MFHTLWVFMDMARFIVLLGRFVMLARAQVLEERSGRSPWGPVALLYTVAIIPIDDGPESDQSRISG